MSVYRQESLWYREEEIRRSYERVRGQVEGFGRELLGRIEALLRGSGLEEVAELIEALRKRQGEVLRGLSYELYRQRVQTELRGSGRYRGWDSMLSFLRQVEANLIEESVEALRRESEEVQHFALRLGRTSLSDPGEVEALLRAVPSYAPRLRRSLQKRYQKLVLTPLRERLSALSPKTAQEFDARFAEAEEASPARFEKIVEEIETQILRLERERYTSSLAPFARPAQSQDESLAYARKRGVHYYERLRSLDPALAQENNALYAELQTTTDPYRASLLHNQLEYLYLTTLRTIEGQEKLKQDLAAAYAAMPVPELKAHLEALLSAPAISEAEAQAFLHKLAHAQPPPPSPSPEAQKEIFSRLFQQLSAAGYQLLSEDDIEAFLQGELVEVRTPFGAEYAVRARLEKNKLNLQFVKYRDSQDSPSDYEKRRDKEIAHRWCADYEKVQKLLAAEGIYAQTAHIIQPDEKLYYLPSQSRKAVADARQKTPQQSQKRQRS